MGGDTPPPPPSEPCFNPMLHLVHFLHPVAPGGSVLTYSFNSSCRQRYIQAYDNSTRYNVIYMR